MGHQTGFVFNQMWRKQALFCSRCCVFLTNTEKESYRDRLLVCMPDVYSSVKPQLNSLLAYQPSPVEGYSISSCNSNNHFRSCSPSLSVSSTCLSVSCRLQSTSGNWKWAIKGSRRNATWEARGRAMRCPVIHYCSTLSHKVQMSLCETFTFSCVGKVRLCWGLWRLISLRFSMRCNRLYSKRHYLCATLRLR